MLLLVEPVRTSNKQTYEFNPACACDWCANGGELPPPCGDTGHSWCYGNEHHPPTRSPWARS